MITKGNIFALHVSVGINLPGINQGYNKPHLKGWVSGFDSSSPHDRKCATPTFSVAVRSLGRPACPVTFVRCWKPPPFGLPPKACICCLEILVFSTAAPVAATAAAAGCWKEHIQIQLDLIHCSQKSGICRIGSRCSKAGRQCQI